jgi:hypothetical protein
LIERGFFMPKAVVASTGIVVLVSPGVVFLGHGTRKEEMLDRTEYGVQ